MITLKNESAQLSVLPYRGANTCAWTIDGKAIFYVDPLSLARKDVKFGGGNPIMFPIFSTLSLEGGSSLRYDGRAIELPQHGFARISSHWRPNLEANNRVALYLESNLETKKSYPYDFQFIVTMTLLPKGLVLEQELLNLGSTTMPFVAGFHPYFAVSDPKNCEFIGHLPHRPCYRVSNHGPANYQAHLPHRFAFGVEDVNHHFKREMNELRLVDRKLGRTMVMRPDKSYGAMTVWSEPDQPFVCVEPVTGRKGAFETREQLIRLAPSKGWKGKIEISIEGNG